MSSVNVSIISDYIDIAQNEYVTKYSFNRNFEKLISNDVFLTEFKNGLTNQIETYNPHKTYNKDNYVFYKIENIDTKLYFLRSKQNDNTHKPLVEHDIQTNALYVIMSQMFS